MILESFMGLCPEGMEACHNDGNRTNNRLLNLRWDTPKGNCADRKKHGTNPAGERNPKAKLTEFDVLEIVELIELGYTKASISRVFRVSESAILSIAKGINWAYITGIKKKVS
jgi:hypothetical protein